MSDAEKWMLLTIHANGSRRMHSTRTQDVIISQNGAVLAQKTIVYKRCKIVDTSFLFYPAGLALLPAHHS